jgi:hypothetical protein
MHLFSLWKLGCYRLAHIRDILKELISSDEIANDSRVYQCLKDAEEFTKALTYVRRGGLGSSLVLFYFYFVYLGGYILVCTDDWLWTDVWYSHSFGWILIYCRFYFNYDLIWFYWKYVWILGLSIVKFILAQKMLRNMARMPKQEM